MFFEDLARGGRARTLAPSISICHIAFDQPPLTRRERANNVRKRNYFTKYGETAREVLDALLDKYADEGVDDIEDIDVLKVRPLDQPRHAGRNHRGIRRQRRLPRRPCTTSKTSCISKPA